MTSNTSNTSNTELLDRFDALSTALRSELVERDAPIHGALVGLVSRTHVLLYGGPGLAKSMLVDRLMARISGVAYQKIPLHRFSTADDLLGPLDVRSYAEEGRWRRLLTNYIAEAEVVNLEELFRCGQAALGTLLSCLNERVIRDDGQIKPIPLQVVFATTNEMPTDESLAAFLDRVPLRYVIEAPHDRGSYARMLTLPAPEPEPEPILTAEDLRQAQEAAAALPVAPQVAEKMTELHFALLEQGVTPTPRRLKVGLQAMRGEAWLDGSDVVAVEHMSILSHALWDVPGQLGTVGEAVMAFANPLEQRIRCVLDGVAEVRKVLPAAIACKDEEERSARGLEAYHRIVKEAGEVQEVIGLGGTGRRQRELVDSARVAVHEVLVELITKVMGMSLDELPDDLGIFEDQPPAQEGKS